MSQIRPPLPVKLFVGMLSPEPELFGACSQFLQRELSPIDAESECMPWDGSDYYREEMGQNLFRKFLFFGQTMDPGRLPSIKRLTSALEKNFAVDTTGESRRRINIDPGYITEAKVVLASAKDFAHRVYIGDGIYGEVTLRFSAKDRTFLPLEHTFPDFRTAAYLALFNTARENLRARIRSMRLT